jgi:Co/Zn/Cd efflux system component
MTEITLTDTAPTDAGFDAVALRRVAKRVVVLNLAYFGIEFAVARAIGSVSLFADSIDFLEDAAVNMLIIMALGWRRERRAAVGGFLAAFLLVPGLATAWTAWQKFSFPLPPAPFLLSLTGLGALLVNFSCAWMLAHVRHAGGSLSRVAFLSARNDVLANVAIVAVGGITLLWHSAWPDLLVGLGIFAINLDAAQEVYRAARQERQSPPQRPT